MPAWPEVACTCDTARKSDSVGPAHIRELFNAGMCLESCICHVMPYSRGLFGHLHDTVPSFPCSKQLKEMRSTSFIVWRWNAIPPLYNVRLTTQAIFLNITTCEGQSHLNSLWKLTTDFRAHCEVFCVARDFGS